VGANKYMEKTIKKLTENLVESTQKRDKYEIEYELEKARMLFSAEIDSLKNQAQRDAQLTILLNEKGMYRKMAELKSKARVDWYKWSTVKSLIDGKVGD